MHILIDYRSALRERTGVGEYVHRLTEAMVPQLRTGERITLFSSSWKDRLLAPPDGAARLDLRIPVKLLNLAWHRLEWPPVERFGVQPDVTWSLHPLLMPSSTALQAVTVHDLYFLDRPEDTVREIRRDYAALAAAHTRRADLVIVNSEYTRREAIRRLGVEERRLILCHPGVFPPAPAPRAPGGPILHLGTIEPRKNVHTLIKAYQRLAAGSEAVPPLVFAGKLAEPMVHAADADLRESIRFLGYVDEAEKRRLLRSASLLVVPSAEEGFGMPALEAMAYGVPIVAANRGALPEVLGDAALLVDGDSPEAFASAMACILDDHALRATLGAKGPERSARFTWERSAAALLDAFRAAYAARRTPQ